MAASSDPTDPIAPIDPIDPFEAFLFGLRVFQAANDVTLKAADDRTWQCVQQVASGELTIVPSAADTLRKYPNMKVRLRDSLQDGVNAMVKSDRRMAQAMLDALDESNDRMSRRPTE